MILAKLREQKIISRSFNKNTKVVDFQKGETTCH
jgi:hypothetical protein